MDVMQESYTNKLKNRLYKCLCEREANGDWLSCLDAILIELIGIPENKRGINYYTIFYNLSACKYLDYKYFRKTIFNTMSLLGETNELL